MSVTRATATTPRGAHARGPDGGSRAHRRETVGACDTVYIALGSSLGDRAAHLRAALSALDAIAPVAAISRAWISRPSGGQARHLFINAVCAVRYGGDLELLLSALRDVERRRRRSRGTRWGDRTLDLDIVAATDALGRPRVVSTPRLQVPHPRAHQRDFVLVPLAELNPALPLAGRCVRAWLETQPAATRTLARPAAFSLTRGRAPAACVAS